VPCGRRTATGAYGRRLPAWPSLRAPCRGPALSCRKPHPEPLSTPTRTPFPVLALLCGCAAAAHLKSLGVSAPASAAAAAAAGARRHLLRDGGGGGRGGGFGGRGGGFGGGFGGGRGFGGGFGGGRGWGDNERHYGTFRRGYAPYYGGYYAPMPYSYMAARDSTSYSPTYPVTTYFDGTPRPVTAASADMANFWSDRARSWPSGDAPAAQLPTHLESGSATEEAPAPEAAPEAAPAPAPAPAPEAAPEPAAEEQPQQQGGINLPGLSISFG
jgi:hypothetical protein